MPTEFTEPNSPIALDPYPELLMTLLSGESFEVICNEVIWVRMVRFGACGAYCVKTARIGSKAHEYVSRPINRCIIGPKVLVALLCHS